MKKIFITGGAGYVGTTLIPMLLKRNYEVTVLDSLIFNNGDRLVPFMADKNFNFVKGDVRNTELMTELIKDKDVVSASIVGSYSENKDIKKIGDFDVVVIFKKLTKKIFLKILKRVKKKI